MHGTLTQPQHPAWKLQGQRDNDHDSRRGTTRETSACKYVRGKLFLPRSRSPCTKALRRGSACCASGELRATFRKDSR